MALCCVRGPLERSYACWQDNRMTLSTSALLVSVLRLISHVTSLHVVIWPSKSCDFTPCHVICPSKSCDFTVSCVLSNS